MENPKILVIDGDPKNLQILRESLESAKFRVITTGNGEDGWALAKSEKPNIIVSEVDTPGIDGFQLLGRLQKDTSLALIPLVFLTNRRNLEDRIKSLRTGVKDYMIKPLHVKEVIARLQMILRRMERVQTDESETARKLVGRLEDHSVEQLLENYGVEKRTGVLSLYDSFERSGEIYFSDGAVVNARLGNFRAEKAVYQMMPWDRGHYIMTFKDVEIQPEITVSNLGLLLQGFKRMQEREKLLSKLPDIDSKMVTSPLFKQILSRKSINQDALKFITLFDGSRTIEQVIAESSYDDIKTLQRIARLYEQGFIQVPGSTPKIPSIAMPEKKVGQPENDSVNMARPQVGEVSSPQSEHTDSNGWADADKAALPLPFSMSPMSEPMRPERPQANNDLDLTEAEEPQPEAQSKVQESDNIDEQSNDSEANDLTRESIRQHLMPPFMQPPKMDTQTDDAFAEESFSESVPKSAADVNGAKNGHGQSDIEHVEHVEQNWDSNKSANGLHPGSSAGLAFDSLLNGSSSLSGHFVVISSNSKHRQQFVSTLTAGRFASQSLGRGERLEIGKLVTPKERTLEVIGLSTEQRFLQLIEQVANTLIGYIVLITGDEPSNLKYVGYLISSLKKKFQKPHVLAIVRDSNSRKVPLDFVRYSLQMSESEQIVEVDVSDAESLTHLIEQLKIPQYLEKDASKPEQFLSSTS